jgi:hypothetical protein
MAGDQGISASLVLNKKSTQKKKSSSRFFRLFLSRWMSSHRPPLQLIPFNAFLWSFKVLLLLTSKLLSFNLPKHANFFVARFPS